MVLLPLTKSTSKPAFAALSYLGREHLFNSHHALKASNELSEPFEHSSSTPPTSTSSDKDWFADGREAARLLKLELGITSEDTTPAESIEELGTDKFALSNAMLESGRAAARELLREMNEGFDDDVDGKKKNEEIQFTQDDKQTSLSAQYFDFPSIKSHCMTICMVPPPSASNAWEQLTEARKECRDPGFFRWPPHANLLYPFIESKFGTDDGAVDKLDLEESENAIRAQFIDAVVEHLSTAAEQCKPFEVTLDSFGTFGGKSRGVLWAYPRSKYSMFDGGEEEGSDDDEEPLTRLQNLLEQQFPMCKDQKKQGTFTPHITISHYANNTDALTAKEGIESKWQPVSFPVSEVYLLQRKGDDGQFKIAATIPLGRDKTAQLHDPPIPFPSMPLVEEEWVHDERILMKQRRKGNFKRRRR